jgi:hypothetical protein
MYIVHREIFENLYFLWAEVGAGAFSLFRDRERDGKKGVKASRIKSAKKAEVPSAKEKTRTGNPVPEPKAARQGGKQGS